MLKWKSIIRNKIRSYRLCKERDETINYIGQMNLGVLKRLAVTQSPVKAHQQTLV